MNPESEAVKRAIDIVGAAAGLAVAAPILALAACAIKLEDRGPVLFRQDAPGARRERVRDPQAADDDRRRRAAPQ